MPEVTSTPLVSKEIIDFLTGALQQDGTLHLITSDFTYSEDISIGDIGVTIIECTNSGYSSISVSGETDWSSDEVTGALSLAEQTFLGFADNGDEQAYGYYYIYTNHLGGEEDRLGMISKFDTPIDIQAGTAIKVSIDNLSMHSAPPHTLTLV